MYRVFAAGFKVTSSLFGGWLQRVWEISTPFKGYSQRALGGTCNVFKGYRELIWNVPACLKVTRSVFQGVHTTCCASLFDVFPRVPTINFWGILSALPGDDHKVFLGYLQWSYWWICRESNRVCNSEIVFQEVMGAGVREYQVVSGRWLFLLDS